MSSNTVWGAQHLVDNNSCIWGWVVMMGIIVCNYMEIS